MARWIGLVPDPTAGGTNRDTLVAGLPAAKLAVPTLFLPATTAQIDAGLTNLTRTDEVRGRRGDTAPTSFASAPKATVGARAYPAILRPLLRAALGGTVAHKSGWKVPEPTEDTVEPLQEGNLPAYILWLLREEQLDRLVGGIVSELACTFPVDAEGSFTATLDGLFHDAQSNVSPKEPDGITAAEAFPTPSYAEDVFTFMLRDAVAFRGASLTEIPNLAGFDITFNNGMIEELQTTHRPNHNIEKTIIDSVTHKLWHKNRHKIGPQAITGKVTLSGTDAAAEAKRLLTHAEKLVFEIAAGPLATTPAANESMKITLYNQAATGGGAEPLVRQGDQRASFDFSGYIDPATGKDIAATFVAAAQIT